MDQVYNFLNSSFFFALVTIVVGSIAFRIYKKQKRDAKRDAANVILLEIEGAEQQLQTVTQRDESGSLAENIYLMKNSSWDKHRYYFTRDFDRNEWDKISDFYNQCLQYDAAVAYNNNYFGGNVEKVQAELQAVLAAYAKDFTNASLLATTAAQKKELRGEYEKKKSLFREIYGVVQSDGDYPPPYFYNPQKPVNEAKAVLSRIEKDLSLTSVGIKLKRLASNKSFLQRFRELLRSV